jgi:hypothetical protein
MDDSEIQPLLNPTSDLYETLSYESIQDVTPNGRPVVGHRTIPEPATYGRSLIYATYAVVGVGM